MEFIAQSLQVAI